MIWEGVEAGECGSLVLDAKNNEVYGHVIASDDFSEAFAVPFHETIQDIRDQLGVGYVGVATDQDIVDTRRALNASRASDRWQQSAKRSTTAFEQATPSGYDGYMANDQDPFEKTSDSATNSNPLSSDVFSYGVSASSPIVSPLPSGLRPTQEEDIDNGSRIYVLDSGKSASTVAQNLDSNKRIGSDIASDSSCSRQTASIASSYKKDLREHGHRRRGSLEPEGYLPVDKYLKRDPKRRSHGHRHRKRDDSLEGGSISPSQTPKKHVLDVSLHMDQIQHPQNDDYRDIELQRIDKRVANLILESELKRDYEADINLKMRIALTDQERLQQLENENRHGLCYPPQRPFREETLTGHTGYGFGEDILADRTSEAPASLFDDSYSTTGSKASGGSSSFYPLSGSSHGTFLFDNSSEGSSTRAYPSFQKTQSGQGVLHSAKASLPMHRVDGGPSLPASVSELVTSSMPQPVKPSSPITPLLSSK